MPIAFYVNMVTGEVSSEEYKRQPESPRVLQLEQTIHSYKCVTCGSTFDGLSGPVECPQGHLYVKDQSYALLSD